MGDVAVAEATATADDEEDDDEEAAAADDATATLLLVEEVATPAKVAVPTEGMTEPDERCQMRPNTARRKRITRISPQQPRQTQIGFTTTFFFWQHFSTHFGGQGCLGGQGCFGGQAPVWQALAAGA